MHTLNWVGAEGVRGLIFRKFQNFLKKSFRGDNLLLFPWFCFRRGGTRPGLGSWGGTSLLSPLNLTYEFSTFRLRICSSAHLSFGLASAEARDLPDLSDEHSIVTQSKISNMLKSVGRRWNRALNALSVLGSWTMAILYNKVNTFSSDEMITPGRVFSCSSSMACLASIPPEPEVVVADVEVEEVELEAVTAVVSS